MPTSPDIAHHAGRVAAISRHNPGSPALPLAKRDLAAAKIEAYVTKVVAAAPPLTVEQAARIAVILRGGAA